MRLVGWIVALFLLAGCEQTERSFDNPLVEDGDGDGVTAAYDCDDTDPDETGLCAYGESCTLDSQCGTHGCHGGTCKCVDAWLGDSCDQCPSNWTGSYCDRCAAGYAGLLCDLVTVEPGTFWMGSPGNESGRNTDEEQREVTLTQDFAIGAFEVTQAQWQAVMGNNPSKHIACGDDCPVEQVNWWMVLSFLNARSQAHGLAPCFDLSGCSTSGGSLDCSDTTVGLNSTNGTIYGCEGYRLPTEAEWEYAYRAGTTSAFYNGTIVDTVCSDPKATLIAWYCENANNSPHPVGEKTPNGWQLHDMAGNVGEWTWDCPLELPQLGNIEPNGPYTLNPVGAAGYCAAARGGNWLYPSFRLRAADRFYKEVDAADPTIGFRIALSGTLSPETATACPDHVIGENCEYCESDYYPDGVCDTYCDPEVTCTGHGLCGSDGTCLCEWGWSGSNCDWFKAGGK